MFLMKLVEDPMSIFFQGMIYQIQIGHSTNPRSWILGQRMEVETIDDYSENLLRVSLRYYELSKIPDLQQTMQATQRLES